MGRTWMSREEVLRAGILEPRVGRGELKQVEVASLLGISYRQNQTKILVSASAKSCVCLLRLNPLLCCIEPVLNIRRC